MLWSTHDVERASQLLQVVANNQDDGIFVMKYQSLGFGFKCIPMGGSDETVHSRINNFLNNEWPTGMVMQFCLYSTDNINKEMNEFAALRINNKDPLFKETIMNRIKYLQEGSINPIDPSSGLKVRNINLAITFRLPHSGEVPTDIDFEKARDTQIIAKKGLTAIGLNPEVIDADGYVCMMDDLLNHGEDAFWRNNNPREAECDKTLNEQVFDENKAFDVDEDGVTIGDTRIHTLGVKRFPEAAYPGFGVNYIGDIMTGARGLKCNFLLNCSIYFPEVQKTKSAIDTKRQFTTSQNSGPLRKFVPILGLKNHGFNVLNEALDDGDKPVQVYFSISVMDDSREKALEAAANAQSYFSELRFQVFKDKYYVHQLFLNSIPFGSTRAAVEDLKRYKTMATRHASVLLPIFGDWKGTGNPVMNFISRNGQIMNMDLYDSGTNFNAVMAASSGAGKSFCTSFMISNYLSIGGKVWVIDVGRSYLNLCDIYGGDFVHFGDGSNICLNPFELVQEFDKESDMLCGLVAAMAAPTEKLTDHQMANLKKVMSDIWGEVQQDMSIDLIQERLLESDDRRVKDIGEQLFSFTTRGDYGKFFNGKNNVTFQNRFTVLELDDLQGREHLMQVVLLQLIYQIQQDMYLGERDRPKLTIIDEAWSLLTKGDVATFIEHGYRRFRKYGGAALTVTQSVLDLYSNETGRAIVENSANMYLLKQKGEAINRIKEMGRLPLTDGGYELLKTVTTVPMAYSELYFITEYGQGIGRLFVDPFQALVASTSAKDVNALTKKKEAGMSIEDAITDLLRERGQLKQ